jgi:hypothetical protein
MDVRDTELVQENIDKDGELKTLWEEHLQFEKKLEKMERKPFLTPEEKVEKKRLQVAKLNGKTKIEAILSKYRGLRDN